MPKKAGMAQLDILGKIKQLRKGRGLSQADMAEALHIALKTYQNIEGGVTRIDIDRLGQIAEVLGADLHQLLGKDGMDNDDVARFISEEKALYHKIIHDKEAYIAQLEDSIRFYREILRESRAC
ncbi:helix-turn-helix domain-containing protein [Parapedobacter sp. DT-150]|uniref:helix-turn-helix domain-containing protein n=1 Tax=Parapedobacter sp. DT-150 TaxID=3396162 RepID=UPI003F1A4A28